MTDHKAEWVLVPRVATEAMLEAAQNREDDEPLSDWGKFVPAAHADIYAAMIAAAPAASEGEDGAVGEVIEGFSDAMGGSVNVAKWEKGKQPPIGTKLYTHPAAQVAATRDPDLCDHGAHPADGGCASCVMEYKTGQQNTCRCVDCGGDQPRHDPSCTYMRDLHGEAATPKHDEGRIAEAVNRFLCWRLPDDFAPDAGISYTPTPRQPGWLHDLHPTGTNLFNAAQAKAMFEHCLATQPAARRVTDESWWADAQRLYDGCKLWPEYTDQGMTDLLNLRNHVGKALESFAQPAEGVSGG